MISEYLETRCCMCPNIQKNDRICPGIPGTPHPEDSPCRFVKAYIDDRGWRYRVMANLSETSFRIKYLKVDRKRPYNSWKGFIFTPIRQTFDEAQADLNALAKEKGWREWNG